LRGKLIKKKEYSFFCLDGSMPKVTQAHLDARRTQILDAAQRCFAREGLHETTMQDICAEAELSPGAIYRYFKGKREILEGVFDQSLEENAGLAELANLEDPLQGFELLVRAMFGIVLDPSQHADMRFGVMVLGEAVRDDAIGARYRKIYEVMLPAFGGIVDRLKEAGHVDPELDTEHLVRVVAAVWEGYRFQYLVDPGMDPQRFIDTTLRLILNR